MAVSSFKVKFMLNVSSGKSNAARYLWGVKQFAGILVAAGCLVGIVGAVFAAHRDAPIHGEVTEPVLKSALYFSTLEDLDPETAWTEFNQAGRGEPLGDGAFGFSEEMFWVLVKVCGAGKEAEPLTLDIRNPHIDRLDAWTPAPDGSLRLLATTGDALQAAERTTPNRRPVVHLPAATDCQQVLLRVDKRLASVSIPLSVMRTRTFLAFDQRTDMVHGGIFAVFLLAIALGVAGFVHFRERRFVSYSAYATIRWLYMFFASGYANMTLFAENPAWTNPLRVAIVLPLVLSLLWFVGDHFDLRKLNRRWHRRNQGMMLFVGLGFVVTMVMRAFGWADVPQILKGMYAVSSVCLIHLVALAWAMRRSARRATGYFAAAFGGSMAVAAWVMLEELGAVPFVDFAVPLVMQRLMERQALLLRVEQADAEKMRAYVDGLEEERQRVARELHDDVGADLALISHQIHHPPPLVDAIQGVIRSVRRLSSALNPIGIYRLPLDEKLRHLADSYAVVPVEIHLSLDPWPTEVTGRIEFECFRIAQEALQNAVKHAAASQIFLSLHHDPDHRSFSLTIEDNGSGFDLSGDNLGQGLQNMQYRADLIGATWSMESAIGKGTFVSVSGELDALPAQK
jgi:signal transduction histidine kinase